MCFPPNRWISAILLLLIVSAPHVVFSQRPVAFVPSRVVYTNDTLMAYVKARLKQDISAITYTDKQVKEDIRNVYEERTKLIEGIIKSGTIVNDSQINAYYQRILQNVLRGNPWVKPDIHLLVVRHEWPNAVCYGNGVLLINLGLVEYLENESQIAFIISHEIAHQQFDHVNKSISKRAVQLNSYEVRLKLKDATKDKEGAKSELLKLVKKTSFDIRRHSRDYEMEADSIALLLMQNTPYDYRQGVRTMDILDSIDQDFFSRSILSFRWFFDSLPIPYKSSWEFYKKGSSLQEIQKARLDSMEDDSLKTHPDCMVRKAALMRQSARYGSGKALVNVQGEDEFRYQLNASYVEVINALYTDSNYAAGIYKSMEMAHIYQDDAYPHMIISSSLGELNIHQRNRTLGKVLPLPLYSANSPYDRLVAFLNELSRSETAALGYWYLRKTVAAIPANEDYIYAMFITAYAFDKTQEAAQYRELYNTGFPGGKYQSRINRFTF